MSESVYEIHRGFPDDSTLLVKTTYGRLEDAVKEARALLRRERGGQMLVIDSEDAVAWDSEEES